MSRVYDAELKSLNKTASRSLFASAEDDDLEQFASSIVAVLIGLSDFKAAVNEEFVPCLYIFLECLFFLLYIYIT